MTTTTLSSRELNQDLGRAKRAANAGPVFITDRGKPAHVLLSIADALAMPGAEDITFDPPKARVSILPADFS